MRGSESYEWLLGTEKFSGLSSNGPQRPNLLVRCLNVHAIKTRRIVSISCICIGQIEIALRQSTLCFTVNWCRSLIKELWMFRSWSFEVISNHDVLSPRSCIVVKKTIKAVEKKTTKNTDEQTFSPRVASEKKTRIRGLIFQNVNSFHMSSSPSSSRVPTFQFMVALPEASLFLPLVPSEFSVAIVGSVFGEIKDPASFWRQLLSTVDVVSPSDLSSTETFQRFKW